MWVVGRVGGMLLWQMQLSRPEGCKDSVATPSPRRILQDGERGRWGLSGVLRSPSGWRLNLKKYYILIPGLRGTPRDSAGLHACGYLDEGKEACVQR